MRLMPSKCATPRACVALARPHLFRGRLALWMRQHTREGATVQVRRSYPRRRPQLGAVTGATSALSANQMILAEHTASSSAFGRLQGSLSCRTASGTPTAPAASTPLRPWTRPSAPRRLPTSPRTATRSTQQCSGPHVWLPCSCRHLARSCLWTGLLQDRPTY